MKPILIHKSDSTIFANVNKFLTFNLETDLDLTGWQAKFILGWVEKTIDDISLKSFEIVLSADDTKQLRTGKQFGIIILTDSNGNIKTVTNSIPFEVTTAVVENEYQEIDLTIPESSEIDIKLKVGASTVTSVNGMTGDVYLDIPSIEGLATEEQLQQGLDTKQPVGEYLTEIPEEYVKNTDYATSATGGVIKADTIFGCKMANGNFVPNSASLAVYTAKGENFWIGKGTLENIKDDYVKRGVTKNTIELSDTEKASAKQWLGFATPAEIMQAIASIPQFSISLVDELPLTGEKMVLYLVPREETRYDGTKHDTYGEYIWIEQTASYEFLGTTAPDLTDYVKNTDYANSSNAGVIKADTSFGVKISSTGYIEAYSENLTRYPQRGANFIIGKGTLENIKNDLVKRAVTENDIELTADEQTNARTWLGAVGKSEYPTSSKAGVVTVSSTYGTGMAERFLCASIHSLSSYKNTLVANGIIGKGTLDNVLTQYKKCSDPMTEAEYEELETKDANTLYLIEE